MIPMLAVIAVLAQDPSGTLIVTNKAAGTASIIDVAAGRVLAELPTGDGPHEVVASSNGRTAVVTNYGAQTGGNTLTVIDVAGRRVARTIDLGQYTRPHGAAFLPGDSIVAVTSETTRNVVLVRVADGSVVRALPTGEPGSHMLAVTADGSRIYTGNIPTGNISEINVASGARTRTFSVPPQPEAVTVSGDGAEVWAGSNAQGSVSVVMTRDGSATTVLSGLGWPYRILLTPDGRRALVPDYRGGSLRIVDRATRAERARVALSGPQGIAVSADSRFAFVSLPNDDAIAVVDLDGARVIRQLPAGSRPDGIAWVR